MHIRGATPSDLPRIMEAFTHAREYMAREGNATQWADGYPTRDVILADMARGESYVIEHPELGVVGTFCYAEGDDPTYTSIEDGAWLNDSSYGTIHRIASTGACRGILRAALGWAETRQANLRIDTHASNATMLHLLAREGFVRCGTIYCRDGSPRIALQRSR